MYAEQPADVAIYNRDRQPIRRRPVIILPPDTTEPDSFLGLGKRARARKDARFEMRMKKKEAKIADRSYKKQKKADALATRYSGKAQAAIIQAEGERDANMLLAQQGITPEPVQRQPDLASQALGIAGGLFGGNQTMAMQGNGDSAGAMEDAEVMTEDELAPSSLGKMKIKNPETGNGKKDSSMMMIVIIGAAALLFFTMKK